MTVDIGKVPFSAYGSYMAVSKLPGDFRGLGNRPGFFLRSINGLTYIPNLPGWGKEFGLVARLVPLYNGTEVGAVETMTPWALILQTAHGSVSICFADTDTLLVRGESAGLGLRLEIEPCSFTHTLPIQEQDYFQLNCMKLGRRFVAHAQTGTLALQQDWGEIAAFDIAFTVAPGDDGFLLVLTDMAADWTGAARVYDFDASMAAVASGFRTYADGMPAVPAVFAEVAAQAAYVNWASTVKQSGNLTREAMLMSKNWMCNIWSWDHCFNALALAERFPDKAWDQFIIMFDYQDKTGAIPDYVNNIYTERGFCKPPVHGWALSKLRERMILSAAQKEEAYDRLGKWTRWWLNYRDHDNDGVCEYIHGNDSGWDNATAFRAQPGVELPDLAAFLILQMDVLAALADELGRPHDAREWREKSDRMLSAMLAHCFPDGKPRAVTNASHEVVENESLILYLPIVLAEKLPKDVAAYLMEQLMSGRFLTEHGFATEAPASEFYMSDGYWRGPIWAPSTMILLDGLSRLGAHDFARDVAERFCKLVRNGGFAENFDALTGQGHRDPSYTWTSSIFLLLANTYLLEG